MAISFSPFSDVALHPTDKGVLEVFMAKYKMRRFDIDETLLKQSITLKRH